MQVVASGPDVPGDTYYDAILTAFFQARERIWIATPYFIPDEAITRGLILAARRGLDVRLLVPLRSNHLSADIAGGSYLRQIERAGASVHLYAGGMMHAKVTLIEMGERLLPEMDREAGERLQGPGRGARASPAWPATPCASRRGSCGT